jgi:DNA-binding PadR family transcriptional regulator
MKVKEYLPLTETSFFILLSIAASPKHGYAIMKDVEAMSEQRVVLATGTLYSALKRMLEDGWIERVEVALTNGELRERKLYKLTDLGRKILDAEIDRLHKLVKLTQLKGAREER